MITGAYSLVRQAIQLGFLPRLAILHTSEAYSGQIYIPRVNAGLLLGVLLLVGLFHTSSALASAYGIAVATTMVADGLLGFIVIWKLWRLPLWRAVLLVIPLVIVDATFLSANMLKILEGAWVPLLFGISMVLLIITWRRGTEILAHKTRRTEVPLDVLLRSLEKKPPPIVPGTAVFLTSTPESTPTALLHNLKHNKILHEQNVILTIVTADTPRVDDHRRVTITPISPRFSHVTLKFGYMETPNVPKALAIARKQGLHFDIMSTSFFLSRRALKPATHSGMPRWQDRLFIGLARSADDASEFFRIPTGRVVEVGTQVRCSQHGYCIGRLPWRCPYRKLHHLADHRATASPDSHRFVSNCSDCFVVRSLDPGYGTSRQFIARHRQSLLEAERTCWLGGLAR